MLYRRITKKYQYELKRIECFIVDLPDVGILASVGSLHGYVTLVGGVLTIQKFYQWDGSSVPLKKWWRWIWNSDKYCKVASLEHDALYQLMQNGLLSTDHKDYIDAIYGEKCIKGGMGKRQAALRVWALQKFAKVKVEPAEEQEILEAI
jgi:hypothetical protein